MTSLRILLSLGNSLAFPCDDPQTVHQVTFHQPSTRHNVDHVNLGGPIGAAERASDHVTSDGQILSGTLISTVWKPLSHYVNCVSREFGSANRLAGLIVISLGTYSALFYKNGDIGTKKVSSLSSIG